MPYSSTTTPLTATSCSSPHPMPRITQAPLCLVEHDIWLVEGLTTSLLATLLAGFLVKSLCEWMLLMASRRAVQLADDSLIHRMLNLLFVGQLILVPLQMAKSILGHIREDKPYMKCKLRLAAELIVFS